MMRESTRPGKPADAHRPAPPRTPSPWATDDRWISDCADELACLSLTTVGSPRHHYDELGQMTPDRAKEIDPRRETPHWHGDPGL